MTLIFGHKIDMECGPIWVATCIKMMVITRTAAGVIDNPQYSIHSGPFHKKIGKPLTVDEYFEKLEVGIIFIMNHCINRTTVFWGLLNRSWFFIGCILLLLIFSNPLYHRGYSDWYWYSCWMFRYCGRAWLVSGVWSDPKVINGCSPNISKLREYRVL